MFRLACKLLSQGKKLPILMYHQVLPGEDIMRPFEITATHFEQQMHWISENFQPVDLIEGILATLEDRLPAGAIAVSFDDGYENNLSVALPILDRYRIPATFFIASDYLDGGIMWNDAVLEMFRLVSLGTLDLSHLSLGVYSITKDVERFPAALTVLKQLRHLPFKERSQKVFALTQGYALPTGLMMSPPQVKSLHDAGMVIGGHTLSHPILTKVSRDEAWYQIHRNKEVLESIIDAPIHCFAYPNGKPNQDYDQAIRAMVEAAGYSVAVSTSIGTGTAQTHPFEFPRYTPWRRHKWGFLAQLALNYYAKPTFSWPASPS